MTDIRRSPRASGRVGAVTRAFATAALLTFGAACTFAAGSDTAPAKDQNPGPAAQATAKTATAQPAVKAEAKTTTAAKQTADAAKTAAVKKAEPAAATTSGGNSVTTKPGAAVAKAAPATAKAAPSKPAASKKPATKAARAASAPASAVQSAQPREDAVTYHYNALGRRDPFNPLVDGFIPADQGGAAPPDIGGLKVVGIVWGANDKFALVEDPRGNSMVLRRGDKVMNGVVEGLKRESLIVKITVDGQSQSVEIPLMRKGDDHDNR